MKRIIVVISVCLFLVGCEGYIRLKDTVRDREAYLNNRTQVEIMGGYNGDSIFFYTKNFSFDSPRTQLAELSLENIRRLEKFAQNLVECEGYYEVEEEIRYHTSEGVKIKKEIVQKKCSRIAPKGQFIHEYNDGYYCDRCRKYREIELEKKLESIKNEK